MDKINIQNYGIYIYIYISKLPRINTTYACGRNNNRFKCLMIYVYLPIHYSPTEYINTD